MVKLSEPPQRRRRLGHGGSGIAPAIKGNCMFGKSFVAVCVAAAVAFGAGSAAATTVLVNQTLDISKGTSPVGQPGTALFGGDAFSAVNVQIAEGDTLDWTIKFLPGQSLTLLDPTAMMPILRPDYNGDDILPVGTYLQQSDPGVLQLLGPSDDVLADMTFLLNGVSANYLIGLFFFTDSFPGGVPLDGPITISGLRTVIKLDQYQNIPETVLTYRSATLQIFDAKTDFGYPRSPPSPTPEPSSWALLLLGCGAAGAALRRQRKAGRRYAEVSVQ